VRNSIEWVGDHLEVIDQTKLPAALEMRELRTVADVVDAIERLVVRGAPAIGITAAYGVELGLRAGEEIADVASRLKAARPTAVNLSWAVDRVIATVDAGGSALAEAERMHAEDIEACVKIGEYGRVELASVHTVMTHCNTGRLATTGIGTALGVVYAKAFAGERIEVVATETRPLMQGARLTAWELTDAGIPVTLIADSAAGAALRQGRVQAVIVGCDRVARNGDTANKIGTYAIAVLARASGLPFYVAGPLTSFDTSAPDGGAIEIEERSADEVLRASGAGVPVWNPAFDVTSNDLITAFITDAGVLRPPYEASIATALAPA